jgi:hypothetical protein
MGVGGEEEMMGLAEAGGAVCSTSEAGAAA